ncbi:MAG: radical SAM protein [Ruminococcus flavefaciens]|nr:radical SAM protein [Ruminococcus flavefaciens]
MYEEIGSELENKFNITDFPLNVIVEPGNFCNLNCTTCTNNKIMRPRGRMSILLYKKIIDEIALENPNTRLWLDFYGEPLLQKFQLFYMIDYAKKKGLTNVEINTNGTLLDREMAEMLLDSGIDFISIDCDGFSAEVYESIRVNGKRDVTYANIEHLLKRKQERNLSKPIIEVKAMEMEENKHEIEQIIEYWRKRGAWTTTRRLISWAGNSDNITVNADKDRIACGYAFGTLAITWDGTAVSCVMDVDAKYPYGNVTQETIKSIWKKRNENFVIKHKEHKFDELPLLCQNCNDWFIIGEERFDEEGKTILKNYNNNGSML